MQNELIDRNKKAVVFTGGGSGGHVVPALTLISEIRKSNIKVVYFGSYKGIESNLTRGKVDRYIGVSTGKLRRYIDFQNLTDIFRLIIGLFQSFIHLLLLRSRASTIVSMGGFVSVPTVMAGKVLGYKIIVHEQTSRVGLANKIASIFAYRVFVSFKDSLKYFPKDKVRYSGYPVREEFKTTQLNIRTFEGVELKNPALPILFVTGGGNGSKLLNDKIKENLDSLCEKFTVIHQVGSQSIDEFKSLRSKTYIPLAFLGDEMPDLMKASRYIISRSGAGTVAELIALGKPSLFIPLKIAQKNEQYHNAMEAHRVLGSIVIEEDEFKNCSIEEELKKIPSSSVPQDREHATQIILDEVLQSK
ncbi:UDP-N-acetylglucosamine--N-acetylmuramyl-(pentapeptide) pyrophosphoryl-undecaprenol N-acetylglucosamine transferase [Halobacteriovorax vibrionivorans]|uniref:UDP-N-acetylglucosamine--N-acetylmuramyl-(pentapeptide) pyrophosphoryl-undecaprenol N-acetylglucosamine transferase n=1 Tax=Halobacteriovorax vibrionivorans TaxID=2152716 RepID=A0ABY0IIC2_9BACT|nr:MULTISPECIES: UDP-N-acetylglucosamine--N-acetylmuramyl-(pentapeptide) pyrophosphoryl-undecaprenol N-acetylglucosamine transferase [Halobacteriovorax]RZF22708.1 UDP-N-acetylglucosamine--N-acetylmuramyl-(pentapeptide) pyrophosphoryl-undecaprenol N-acetylglucosamine transferase [Halobacteriovorax vibrionivorans]TGD46729.1 UDP-N-acetylglucosamine--N-acetylmuramyl-(pentapeptide) pyrophosphoryl-undecaprenol N-acetylglucosamine transferase [Halobacteriovorax sp. Y22]